jgi:hypothetical protein
VKPVAWILRAIVAFSLGACARSAPATSAKNDDATTILRSMADRYAKAATYEDRGSSTVATNTVDGTHSRRSQTVFETAFDRKTGGFLFDYRVTHDRFLPQSRGIIWRHGPGHARVFWTVRAAVDEQPIELALAGQTGVSGGVAWNVPSMLLGLGNEWDQSVAFRIERIESIRGVSCFKLAAHERKHHGASSGIPGVDERYSVLWIGRQDHSLRRLFVRSHFTPVAGSEKEILADLTVVALGGATQGALGVAPEAHRHGADDRLRTRARSPGLSDSFQRHAARKRSTSGAGANLSRCSRP